MTNLYSILKTRGIALLTKVHIVKAMVFPVKVKVILSLPTLCNPMDYTVHGICQARILEWVAVSFSRGSSIRISIRIAKAGKMTEGIYLLPKDFEVLTDNGISKESR